MRNWIDSDFFSLWEETQERIRKSMAKSPSPFDCAGFFKLWPQPMIKVMRDWGDNSVKLSLETQSNWLEKTILRAKQETKDLDSFSSEMAQINESMESWTQKQKELWDFWFRMLDTTVVLPTGSENYQQSVNNWKSIVADSLLEQTDWLEKWQEQINYKPLIPGELDSLIEKLNESMNGWIKIQAELWQYGFESLTKVENKTGTSSIVPKSGYSARNDKPNDLREISGIEPNLEKKLNDYGIVSFQQIADLGDAEIDLLEKNIIQFPGRIRRENWVEQAKALCSGKQV